MIDNIMWIADIDAEFLVGADGYPYECFDRDGNAVTLYPVVDDQEMGSLPGSITRLLVVMDGNNKMWGVQWHSVASGTPGFTWDYALTSGRRDESKTQHARWVGFQPVEVVKVTSAEYGFVDTGRIS